MTSTGPVINRKPRPIPGLAVQSYLDNGALTLKLPEDGKGRATQWVRAICFHTTKGLWPQTVKPGFGPHVDDAAKVNRYWSNNHEAGGAQFVVDRDGDAGSMCDCATIAAYHASQVNQVSEGIEIFQESDKDVYAGELDAAVKLCDALTWFYGIQRQIQDVYYQRKPVPRLLSPKDGLNVVGVYGHRDVTTNRGQGDPGDHIYDYCMRPIVLPDQDGDGVPETYAGYEPVNFALDTDIALWKPRQTELNKLGAKLKVDGIPGPATTAAIKRYMPKNPRGLWIVRPIDQLLASEYGNAFDPWAKAA